MNTKLIAAATAVSVVILVSAGIAVNAATLGNVPATEIGRAPEVLVPSSNPSGDLRGDGTPEDEPSDSATPTPTPSASDDDDGLPRHSGEDERPGHDADDDNPDESHSGSGGDDDGDSGDDHSGSGHGGDDSDDDSSGHGGHGSDD